MAIKQEDISEKIFKIMKSYGLQLTLFTEDGKETIDPTEAKRFYSEDQNIMVNFETVDDINKIKVNLGNKVNIHEVMPLLNNIKALANQYALSYTLRTFSHTIEPKDFAYQAQQEKKIDESFSKVYGTVKTSRQKFENSTLYIRHSKRVDEEIRGSRSRNIHAIFVENSKGERFRFPFNNVNAARAMTVHVSEGGNPYDDIGKTIVSLAEEIETLRKFKKKNKELAESSTKFFNYVTERITNIQKQFKQMNSLGGYKKNINTFMEYNVEEVDDAIFEEFGFTFEENENKTYVYNIAKKLKEDRDTFSRLETLVSNIIKGQTFEVIRPISDTDNTNPSNLDFDNIKESLSARLGYLSEIAKDRDLSMTLAQLSDDVYQYDENYLELTKKLLTTLEKGAIVTQQSAEPKGLVETISKQVENKLSAICGLYL